MSQVKRNKELWLIPGAVAVSYLLFGTRWISHIGVFPFYVSDLLLFTGIFFVLWAFKNKTKPFSISVLSLISLCLLGILVCWSAGIYFTSSPSLSGLRDVAPYLYVVAAFLGFFGVAISSDRQIRLTLTFVYFALLGHFVWLLFATHLPQVFSKLAYTNKELGIRLFSPRGDVDIALVSIFIFFNALTVYQSKKFGAKTVTLILLSAISTWLVCTSSTRAGILSLLLLAIWTFWIIFVNRVKLSNIFKLQNIILMVVVILSILIALPTSAAVTRSLPASQVIEVGQYFDSETSSEATSEATSEVASNVSVQPISGIGTAQARLNSWQVLFDWIQREPKRFFFGEGFNANIMHTSGAGVALLGEQSPELPSLRAPHNFVLNSWAHLGIVGVFLFLLCCICFVLSSLPRHRVKNNQSASYLFSLIPIGLLVPSLFGVILEAPFGAIPFWWAIGCVIALNQSHSDSRFYSFGAKFS